MHRRPEQIAPGDDPDDAVPLIDHRQTTDPALDHRQRRLAQGRPWRHQHGRAQ
jgi:hypothetical protein